MISRESLEQKAQNLTLAGTYPEEEIATFALEAAIEATGNILCSCGKYSSVKCDRCVVLTHLRTELEKR